MVTNMKTLHNNHGLYGGYHFRAVQQADKVKIQEIKEGVQQRYQTIATIPATSWDRVIEYKDLSNPAALYQIAVWWNK